MQCYPGGQVTVFGMQSLFTGSQAGVIHGGAVEALQYLEGQAWATGSGFLGGESKRTSSPMHVTGQPSPRLPMTPVANTVAKAFQMQPIPQVEGHLETRRLLTELAEVRSEMEAAGKEEATQKGELAALVAR